MESQYQNRSDLVELLFFEVLERIAIFHIHLKETDIRFFPPRSSKSYEKHFVDSFNECLEKMLHCSVITVATYRSSKNDESKKQSIKQLGDILSSIKELHTSKLGHLPRPPEPPELKRFGRILQKHAVKLEKSSSEETTPSEISVYVGEEISETAYAGDPLVSFKQENVNSIISNTNKFRSCETLPLIEPFPEPVPENLGYHLTIPRIDTTNPCRWPTLVHEVGHRLMKNSFFKQNNIQTDFEAFLSKSNIQLPEISVSGFGLKHWLTECWCDLFGAIVIGPSFFFAQWASFIFNMSEVCITGCRTHPPTLFRLHLIYKILCHRFPEAISPEFKRAAFDAKKLLQEFDETNEQGFVCNRELKQLVLLFQDFFINHFLSGESELNEKLTSLIKYTKNIDNNVIMSMVESLANGLPIPSVAVSDSATWRERPSTVQEILLSAWLYRNTIFRGEVLAKIDNVINNESICSSSIWPYYVGEVVKAFSSFNFSLLRSLQVSEWFHLYEGGPEQVISNQEFLNVASANINESDFSHSALVDFQIYNLIKSGEMKAIPIINFEKQLGSTSLDIRLGTSFQVYSPNQVGVVDFTNDDSIGNANINSTLVDLDYLQPITIAPGQFMLGHSMEFICLPLYVSAQVEGRSSFARLGIEIHMTAGFVDPGFQGVLTFEIYNAGPNPVRLYPGIRIAQLRFFKGAQPVKPYNRNPAAKYRGLLQHHNSLQFQDYEINLLTRAVSPECR